MTLTNLSGKPIAGPLALELLRSSWSAVLVGASGTTVCAPSGNPFVVFEERSTLQPKAAVAVTLEFSDLSNARIAFKAQVLASGAR